ncbi:uncharacterized protein LOC144148568 [Haemaphysalis longicornis]
MIPKAGKPLAPENMRPISLTSSVGKVVEHVFNARISRHIEQEEIFPHNMVGFRPGLSTPDVMWLLKNQVLEVEVEGVRILSPLLFNLVLRDLSLELGRIPGINHALYADDITVWSHGGSEAQTEEVPQTALQITEEYLQDTGLKLSPGKSELLLYRSSRKGGAGQPHPNQAAIELRTRNGSVIPKVDVIRILGMLIQSRENNTKTIENLTGKTEATIRLMMRVSKRRGGLSECNLLRLYNAFLMSHINYVARALDWSRKEENKVNTFMRKSIKKRKKVTTKRKKKKEEEQKQVASSSSATPIPRNPTNQP